jgi:hypothetical protein
MNPIVCLGVDPAPSARGSWVAEFDVTDRGIDPRGKPKRLPHSELRKELKTRSEPCILLAWDAPLTGPYDIKTAGADERPFDFTTRPIERAFSSKITELPEGISVRGYSGCQHWTITRSLLGLPRVGEFDKAGKETHPLPFELIEKFPTNRCPPKMVVEVHPALAIWLWVAEDAEASNIHFQCLDSLGIKLRYKANQSLRKDIIKRLVSRWNAMGLQKVAADAENCKDLVKSDDALDAYVAGVLAALLARGEGEVSIFGNKELGMFLLPKHEQIGEYLSVKNLAHFVHAESESDEHKAEIAKWLRSNKIST